jgi:hypothetical protein
MSTRPGHEKCHHEGGGLFRKTPTGGKETNGYKKLRRKQWFLRMMIEHGADAAQVRRKAAHMNMNAEEYAYILKEAKGGNEYEDAAL